jgi:diacylglycerol kinase family enzyme
MLRARRVWLVVNRASGSNGQEALASLERGCSDAGFAVDRIISFPDQPLPTGVALDRAGVETVAVFAGDGTVNALVAALDGWKGAVLVLPGGTMNLLYHRLHGDRAGEEVVRLAAKGEAKRARPGVIRCEAGTALAEVLVGPGTSWRDVREAMREADLVGIAANAAQALGATLAEPGVVCRSGDFGEGDEYPLIMLTPAGGVIRASGFRAETAADYIQGSWAVLRRRFREGPHDDLCAGAQITLTSNDGERLAVLIDGEPAECPPEAVFRLVPCGVDLLATASDGR